MMIDVRKTIFDPRGRAVRVTPEVIAQLSVITDEDVRSARRLWQRLMPDKWKTLLSARPVD